VEFPDWSFLTPELSYRLKSCPFLFGLRFLFECVGVMSKEERLCREFDDMAEVSDTSRIGIFLVRTEVSNNSSNRSTIFRSVVSYEESEPVTAGHFFYDGRVLRSANARVTNILFTLVYSSFGAGTDTGSDSRLRLILDSGLDESGSLISPFEDMVGYNDKNEEDGCNGKKRGLDDLYGKLLRLHLHYIWLRRKPHGLMGRA
jgi:hypothetical protein